MTKGTAVGTGLLVAAGFFLMQLAWLLSMPAATGIDEFDHIHRASSVASGHWGFGGEQVARKDGRGGLIPVREDVVAATEPGCASFWYVGHANCHAYADAGDDLVLVACAAARYNPLFYAVVGYPSALFHGHAALIVMRLVSAGLSAAMLALGAVALRTWARTGWPVLGLFLAATPTVIYSTSIAAPNGLNIVSGLTLWASLLGLVHGPSDPATRRRLVTISAIAAVTLVNTHSLGLAWLVLIVVAIAVQRGRWGMPHLLRAELRRYWPHVAAAVVGIAFAAGWILAARTNNPTAEGISWHESWWPSAVTVGVPLWPLQAIAAFPMRDQPAPVTVYAIGVSLMLALATKAVIVLVRRRDRGPLLAIGFVAVTSYAVPLVLTAVSFRYIGLAWQGRYEMPFTGGLLLLFALALDQAGTRLPTRMVVAAMGLLALMNFLGQLRVIGQFDDTRLARTIGWSAPSPLLLGLLALGFVIAGTVAVVVVGRRAQQSDPPESPPPAHTSTPEPAGVPVP